MRVRTVFNMNGSQKCLDYYSAAGFLDDTELVPDEGTERTKLGFTFFFDLCSSIVNPAVNILIFITILRNRELWNVSNLMVAILVFSNTMVAICNFPISVFYSLYTYGVVAYAAEGGWFGQLFGISTPTPIPAFIPMMMFAILFGLSMDYQVFLVSRMQEEWTHTKDNHRSIRLAERLGEHCEGEITLRGDRLLLYAIARDAWLALAHTR